MPDNAYQLECYQEISGLIVDDLKLEVLAAVYEVGGERPTNVIRIDQDWYVEVKWRLTGTLARLFCGEWCVCVFLESIGPGPEITLPDEDCMRFDMKPCEQHREGEYLVERIDVEAGTIERLTGESPAGLCGRGYIIGVSVHAIDDCGEPTAIFAYCTGNPLSFYTPES